MTKPIKRKLTGTQVRAMYRRRKIEAPFRKRIEILEARIAELETPLAS